MLGLKERPLWAVIVLLATLSSCQPPDEWNPFAKIQFRGRTGWMLGSIVYMTPDDGVHWRKMFASHGDGRDPAKVAYPITLIDEGVGVCVQDGYLMITTDGGGTWRQSNRTDRFLAEPFFMIEPSGLAFARNDELGGMTRTEDGGRSWHKMEAFGYADIDDLVFWHSNIYALVSGGLFKSSNRGVSWTELQELHAMGAMSLIGDRLWFVGWDGRCSVYDLNTELLDTYPLPTQHQLHSVAGHETTVIVAGGEGSLFVSTTIPPVWRRVDIGRKDSLNSVAFASDGTAFVVGGVEERAFRWPKRLALKSRDYQHWEEVKLPD